jgi:PadR family transcriptional regulator PadR
VAELNQIGQLLTSQGTVYPLLNRLHEAGLVTSYWELGDTERPRRYYRISETGIQELSTFRTDWRRFSTSVDELLETIPKEQNA